MFSGRRLLRQYCKIFDNPQDAVADITPGSTIAVGGYRSCGVPENLLRALNHLGPWDLGIYSMSSGHKDFGLDLLLQARQIKRLTTTYLEPGSLAYKEWKNGNIELDIIPGGTLADKLRAGGAGIPGFYTQTGVGTKFEEGGFPIKYMTGGRRVEILSGPKEKRSFEGVENLFEESIRTQFSFIKAYKADKQGNLIFNKTARNFNPEMATCAKVSIVEVEEIVEVGELDPDHIITPSIFVNRLIKGEKYEKPHEVIEDDEGTDDRIDPERLRIAKRALKEIKEGMYLHLGFGIPISIVSKMIPDKSKVKILTIPGALGVGGPAEKGQEDRDLINALREHIKLIPGSAIVSSCDSMNIMRGGHLDLIMMGAYEISKDGDIASWNIEGEHEKGIGAAMDLVSSRKSKLVCTMIHTRNGRPKIVEECNLDGLTGRGVVDTLITELGVFEFKREGGITLTEIARGVSVDSVKANTGTPFIVASDLKKMD
mmetsp:Transcript_12666/g.12760  ORF Transcript_12666/g.12760 Transcript_12666/m.12760 type:complete len:485 (-) Transcript_12666:28-1482(-)